MTTHPALFTTIESVGFVILAGFLSLWTVNHTRYPFVVKVFVWAICMGLYYAISAVVEGILL